MSVKLKYFRNLMRLMCISACVFCAFVTPAISASLPSGYTELEYLQSSTTQYIDTGVVPNYSSTGIMVDGFEPSSKSIWGSTSGKFGGAGVKGYLQLEYNSQVYSTQMPYTERHKWKLNKNQVYVDDVLKNTFTLSTGSDNTTIKLFVRGSDTDINDRSSATIYSAKIWNNDVLIRDFVPAKRKSDVVLGMYDTANSGKNLFDAETAMVNDGWTKSGNYWTRVSWAQKHLFDNTKRLSGSFTFSVTGYRVGGTATSFRFHYTDGSMTTPISLPINVENTMRYTTDKNRILDYIDFDTSNSPTSYVKDIQLEYGSSATAYEPYPFYTNAGTGTFIAGPEVIKVATTKYVESAFADSVSELNTAIGTVKTVVDNTIIQADRIGKLHTGKQNRPDEQCPKGRECLLITEADGSLHWYPICDANGSVAPIEDTQ